MVDPLGSVIGTIDESGSVVNTYRYKPYGALLAKTGSGADPANTWVGAWGYRQTGKRYSDAYVRARHYGSLQASWASVRNGPATDLDYAYKYAFNCPSTFTDPIGNYPQKQGSQAPNPLTITIKSPGKLTGACGRGTFIVHWNIEGTPNGWIIQHLKWSVTSIHCDTHKKLEPTLNPYPRELWEGWQVRKGKVYDGFVSQGEGGDDLFGWNDEAINSFGTIAIDAEVAFLKNYNLTVPPWDPLGFGTGGLPQVSTAPAGWPPGETLPHSISVSYNCCKCGPNPPNSLRTVPS